MPVLARALAESLDYVAKSKQSTININAFLQGVPSSASLFSSLRPSKVNEVKLSSHEILLVLSLFLIRGLHPLRFIKVFNDVLLQIDSEDSVRA